MNGIDAFALQQASCHASLLVASAGFKAADWEDLKHDILLDLLRRAPKFNSLRGDWQGFVRGVTRNQSTVLIGRHRRRAWEVLAGDLTDCENGDPIATVENLRSPDAFADLRLRLDVRSVLAGLPPQLRSLALLLAEMSVKEVCKHMGKSRSRVYQMTLQVREAFVRAGFGRHGPSNRRSRRRSTPAAS